MKDNEYVKSMCKLYVKSASEKQKAKHFPAIEQGDIIKSATFS